MDEMSDQEARALLEDHNHHPRVMLSFLQLHSKRFHQPYVVGLSCSVLDFFTTIQMILEIGRASCRERV